MWDWLRDVSQQRSPLKNGPLTTLRWHRQEAAGKSDQKQNNNKKKHQKNKQTKKQLKVSLCQTKVKIPVEVLIK